MRSLRVAAIQMIAEPGRPSANRRRAEALVERAAKDGAKLAVLPELFAPGYRADRDVWSVAEPEGRGPTVTWLRSTAKRLGALSLKRAKKAREVSGWLAREDA